MGAGDNSGSILHLMALTHTVSIPHLARPQSAFERPPELITKAVAADYVQKGIRCNGIAPGTVDTPSLHERIGAFADPVEARRMFVARQPMGRLAKPEEIAPIIVFLASDEAAFVTGNIYSCDGGMTI